MNSHFNFVSWFPINKINWSYLATNPNAVDFLEEIADNITLIPLSSSEKLEEKYYKFNWLRLAENPNAFRILDKYRTKYSKLEYSDDNITKNFYNKIASNPNVEIFNTFIRREIEECLGMVISQTPQIILETIKQKIDWCNVFSNPNSIDIIKWIMNNYDINENFHDLNSYIWYGIIENPHPEAIKIIRENIEKINFHDVYYIVNNIKLETNLERLMKNPSAILLIKELNLKPDWEILSENPSQEAIDFILESFNNDYNELIEQCSIENFASNPYGIQIIEKLVENKIISFSDVYIQLSKNPNAVHILSQTEIFKNVKKVDVSFYEREFYENLSANPCIFEETIINLK